MYRLTDIISKPVISISEGKQIGTAESAVFNKTLSKLTHISVFDLELEDKVYIPASYILNMEKEAIMVKGASPQDETPLEDNCPINAPVYDEEGGLLGRTTDIHLDKTFSVIEIDVAEGGKFSPQNIISYSKHAIVACFDVEKAKKLKKIKAPASKKKEKPQEEAPLQDTITQVMELLPLGLSAAGNLYRNFTQGNLSGENGNPQGFPSPQNSSQYLFNTPNGDNQFQSDQEYDETAYALSKNDIRKIVPPFNYLLGRKATANLYGLSDKPIVIKDSIITTKEIDICRRHGKLIALAKNSKPV